jgi:hypothetical protein
MPASDSKKVDTVATVTPVPVRSTGLNYALKAKYSAYTALVFFLVANPETYKIMQKFLGGFMTIASEGGCPTPAGFFLHTGLFFLLLWSIMLFPRDP